VGRTKVGAKKVKGAISARKNTLINTVLIKY
jgi:hypothetical protein